MALCYAKNLLSTISKMHFEIKLIALTTVIGLGNFQCDSENWPNVLKNFISSLIATLLFKRKEIEVSLLADLCLFK